MNLKPLLENLSSAMGHLYLARRESCGKLDLNDWVYKNMDSETFDEISDIQTHLQKLITRLKRKHPDDRSNKDHGL